MERCYQCCNFGLPVRVLFLMLIKAFADCSTENTAKARPSVGCGTKGHIKCRPHRPHRGRCVPIGDRPSRHPGWDAHPSWSPAASGARRGGQSPKHAGSFGRTGAQSLRTVREPQYSVTGPTAGMLSRVSPFKVGGPEQWEVIPGWRLEITGTVNVKCSLSVGKEIVR